MIFRFQHIELICHGSVERVYFAESVTFIHGPVGTGKSTIARLIDFCLGGKLTKTTAIKSELVTVVLSAIIGDYDVIFERSTNDLSSVRVTWTSDKHESGSVIATIKQSPVNLHFDNVHTLSDLIFYFADIEPIKVRKNKRDPDSDLIRLSFRDLLWYAYLSQEDLDSSFFQMEHPYKGNKSKDAIRFISGYYSDRLNLLEQELSKNQDLLRANNIASTQIRSFLRQFQLGSDVGVDADLEKVQQDLTLAKNTRLNIEAEALENTHAVDPLRKKLRRISRQLGREEESLVDLKERVETQESLLADFINAKVKSSRLDSARAILSGVTFTNCPQCGLQIDNSRCDEPHKCNLCCQTSVPSQEASEAVDTEVLRQDLNTRIDELEELLKRHRKSLDRQTLIVDRLSQTKIKLDKQLSRELEQYDSAYVSRIRNIERKIAGLEERYRQLQKLAELPRALQEMEDNSNKLSKEITNVKEAIRNERKRLVSADAIIESIEQTFFEIMLKIDFPGIEPSDHIQISKKNWQPRVYHGEYDKEGWGFDDAGSGGKRVLFNVCYALSIHIVSAQNKLPVPTFLIIDSPTKNISLDVNKTLIENYFKLIYELAVGILNSTQFILIDSDLVSPENSIINFKSILLSKESPLISYYSGP